MSLGGGQKPLKIGEAGLKRLQQRLQTDGFADLKEIQRFLQEQLGASYSLSRVWYLVHIKLKAKLKTGRPRSVRQEPQAVEAFKKNGLAEVADREIWAQDETRFGLKTWHKRRWMAKGYRPAWVGQQRYQWFYLYGAIEPLSGRSLFWLLPDWTKESAKFFLEELRKEVSGEAALVWDGAGSHRGLASQMPQGITPFFLPRASPELNPIEQVWKALRKELANRIFETLEELQEAVCEALREYWERPEVLISMTAYPWWREALESRHA